MNGKEWEKVHGIRERDEDEGRKWMEKSEWRKEMR